MCAFFVVFSLTVLFFVWLSDGSSHRRRHGTKRTTVRIALRTNKIESRFLYNDFNFIDNEIGEIVNINTYKTECSLLD